MGRLKIIVIAIIAGILLFLPDLMMEFFHAIFELVMHIGHTLFEMLEVLLDLLVEHALHTDLHDTQIVVFYILFGFVCYWIWRFCKVLPTYYRHKKQNFLIKSNQKKNEIKGYWFNMTMSQKIKIISTITVVLTLWLASLFM
jgi:hypothetical protein